MKNALIAVMSLVFVSCPAWATDLGRCSPDKLVNAPAGDLCHTPSADWRVEKETYTGKRVYRDLKSGLKVTDVVDGGISQYNAGSHCNNGYRLPSGYPVKNNGKYGFPNQNSDFTVLESDNIRLAVPGMRDHWFWSSTVNPHAEAYAYVYFGDSGYGSSDVRDSDYEAVLCVQ